MQGEPVAPKSVAVYSTVYPGVERFLPDWYRSVEAQQDQDFTLYVGVDSLDIRSVTEAIGCDVKANWLSAPAGASIAEVRQHAFDEIPKVHDALVLVDADDVMEPSRVAAARQALETAEVSACALSLVDREGADLGVEFTLPETSDPDSLFPRYNVFGLSNSAYLASTLRRCCPIPPDALLVDWYLSTRAWLQGARLGFDRTPRMRYRQHGQNTARVMPPFGAEQVRRDTERVLKHFELVLSHGLGGAVEARVAELQSVCDEVERFRSLVLSTDAVLEDYTSALNALRPAPLWWVTVAHPLLRQRFKY